jgi:hypothetical protein
MNGLIGFAHECGRRDHAGITRVLSVGIERIVVADRESEATNRREPKFLRRRVGSFAASRS